MINLACRIPERVVLACSGGKDSMAALNFLLKGKRDVILAYFNHRSEYGREAKSFVYKAAVENCLEYALHMIDEAKEKDESQEAFWSRKRNEWFRFLAKDFGVPVITAHHLNDSAENVLITTMRYGQPVVIPVSRGPVIRPFVFTPQKELHRVGKPERWIEDPSNQDTRYLRNLVRHKIMPQVLVGNPGFLKVVRRMYDNQMVRG